MKNSSSLILAGLLLAILLGWGNLWLRHRTLTETHAEAKAEIRALRERVTKAERRLLRAKEAPGRLDDMEVPSPEAGGAPAFERAPQVAKGGFAIALGPAERRELQRLHALHEKAALDSRYAALFRALRLSPEKLERLKSLLVDRELAFADTMTAALEQGLDPRNDEAAFQRAVADARADAERAIADLLGAAGYAEYEQYRQTLPQRSVVEQLQQRLSYTPEPLTEAQAAELLRILAATSSAPSAPEGGPDHAVFVSPAGTTTVGGAPISDDAFALAQNTLSTSQLQALREIQQMQQAHEEAIKQLPGRGANGGHVRMPIGVIRRGGG